MNIIEQQLQLHFGDTYLNVSQQAGRFCNYLISRPWWGENRPALITNEGGLDGMRRAAMCSIIEMDNHITAGLKAYSNRLRKEYSTNTLPLDDISEQMLFRIDLSLGTEIGRLETRDVSSSDHLSGGGSNYRLWDLFDNPRSEGFVNFKLTEIELEFFRAYESVQDIREASALVGIHHKDGKRLFDRVRVRAKRLKN